MRKPKPRQHHTSFFPDNEPNEPTTKPAESRLKRRQQDEPRRAPKKPRPRHAEPPDWWGDHG